MAGKNARPTAGRNAYGRITERIGAVLLTTQARMPVLQDQFQRKLHDPWQITLRRHDAELRVSEDRVRWRKLRRIRDVEYLGAELQLQFFGEVRILVQREIELPGSGVAKARECPAGIAEGERWRVRKLRSVDPVI